MSPTMIIPCCGESSRFPGLKKQFMIHPTGVPLPIFSATGIKGCSEHIFVFLQKDFENVFVSCDWFERIALMNGIPDAQVMLLKEQTTSQVETVRMAISSLGMKHTPIFIKDNDNYFETLAGCMNSVSIESIDNGTFEIRNKSFSELDSMMTIKNIQERGVLSKWINCGGYSFQSSDTFMKYSPLSKSITNVIGNIITAGGEFCAIPVSNYKDYGTMKAWVNYLYENYV